MPSGIASDSVGKHYGMRNRLIHAYFDIDLDILWKTIIKDIPPLIADLEKIIPPAA